MTNECEIGMLWVEGRLSFVEILCAKSFVDAGHHVKLFHYGAIPNAPDFVELVDGNTILRADNFLRHGKTGSFALFSDVFRYHLLQKCDRMIWADLDAYCVKTFETATGHFYGWASDDLINGGVLGLPADSDALGQLLEMTEDEYCIPEWYSDPEKRRMEMSKNAGQPIHVGDLPWGVWGPHALTHYLNKTGEAKYALPVSGLYPVNFRDRRKLMKTRMADKIESLIAPETYSVHFYGRRVREYLSSIGGYPQIGSYMDKILKKHEIDVISSPVWSRETG
ncbi:hypothetical protein [Roseovarius sp. D0-M9]|uniref:hypothetical protein n=1 Tax=Roseovarius sp. D0-M9 TaxID=3127117 RepID=UPI00300F9395